MAIFERPSPLVQAYAKWLDRVCTVEGHNAHLRWQCAESRERVLRWAVMLEDPQD